MKKFIEIQTMYALVVFWALVIWFAYYTKHFKVIFVITTLGLAITIACGAYLLKSKAQHTFVNDHFYLFIEKFSFRYLVSTDHSFCLLSGLRL